MTGVSVVKAFLPVRLFGKTEGVPLPRYRYSVRGLDRPSVEVLPVQSLEDDHFPSDPGHASRGRACSRAAGRVASFHAFAAPATARVSGPAAASDSFATLRA